MTNPLLKAAGITPDTPGHSAERALFDAAWACVEALRRWTTTGCDCRECATIPAFDEAAKFFQEEV